MALKRRGFLGLLGAAVATPALPFAAPKLASDLRGLAAFHAQKYPFVSAIGLSKRMGVTVSEGQALLVDLSRRGLVGPVHSCATGPMHAASKVFTPVYKGAFEAARAKHAADRKHAQKLRAETCRVQADLGDWLAHLRKICVENGFALSPRALEQAA